MPSVVYSYANQLCRQINSANFYAETITSYYTGAEDWVRQNCDGSFSSIIGWTLSGHTAASNLSTDSVRRYRAREIPRDLSDASWHQEGDVGPVNMPGAVYAGAYIAMHSDTAGRDLHVFDRNPTRHHCAHCAFVEAKRLLAERGLSNRFAYISMVARTGEIDLGDALPASGEIQGEPEYLDASTFKNFTGEIARACSNCGQIDGHNSRTCELPPKPFLKIGIEIEGKWRDLDAAKSRANNLGMTYCSDGSVRDTGTACGYEFQTRPGSLREALTQLIELYPDETGRDCGMHVHVSFQSATDVTLLATHAFYSYFKRRWEEWGRANNLDENSQFYVRLNGGNDYCRVNATEFSDPLRCDRYHQLNFSAWDAHKTVECRLLPMFHNQRLAVAAVIELIDIYSKFLAEPEAHGLSFHAENVQVEVLKPLKHEAVMPLELPEDMKVTHASKFELELEEILPPSPGMTRIAIPADKPITIDRLRQIARRAA